MSDFFLSKGERGLLVGQTGAGKTENAIFQLRNAPVYPVIIFDTKIEDKFFGLPDADETLDLVEGLDSLSAYSKQSRKHFADYILVRPLTDELQNFEILNQYCQLVYDKFGACTIYYDEVYNWHNRAVPVNAFVGLLTRGRSRGKTVLISTQRPAWISRFCFSESKKFFMHFLADSRDKIALDSMVPNYSRLPDPPEFHFYHFNVGKREAPKLYKPVPYVPLDPRKIFTRKWL